MNKSTFLLLPTVLAVSTSARTKTSTEETARIRPAVKANHDFAHKPNPKSAALDFVFTINK